MEKKDYRLSYDFSDRVMNKINSEIVVREKRNETLMLAVYILASVLTVVAILFGLIYFNVISNFLSAIFFQSIPLPSFSFPLIIDAISSHMLYIVIGINILLLYIVGERLAIRRCLRTEGIK